MIVDKDVIDVTNINRQIIALNSTVGKDKTEVMRQRIKDINPSITVTALKENLTKENAGKIILDFSPDYVVDCVDNIEAKVSIVQVCWEKSINCISSMGMANKLNPLLIKVGDIYSTSVCKLARVMRKRLKELGILKQKVVFSEEMPVKTDSIALGSVSFVPSAAGIVITSQVIRDLLGLA